MGWTFLNCIMFRCMLSAVAIAPGSVPARRAIALGSVLLVLLHFKLESANHKSKIKSLKCQCLI